MVGGSCCSAGLQVQPCCTYTTHLWGLWSIHCCQQLPHVVLFGRYAADVVLNGCRCLCCRQHNREREAFVLLVEQRQ
jgi:hypothetical protein